MAPSMRIKNCLSNFAIVSLTLVALQAESKSLQMEAIEAEHQSALAMANTLNSRLWPELAFVVGYGEQNELHEDPEKGAMGYLQLDWNLFEGGAGYRSYQISKLELDLADVKKAQAEAKLYKSIKQLTIEIDYLKELRKIEDRELELYKKQYAAAERRVQTGVTSSSDLLEIKLNQFETETHLETLLFQLQGKQEELAALGPAPEMTLTEKKSFEETYSAKMLKSLQQTNELVEGQSLAVLLPEINLESKYGQITPQPNSAAKQDEYHVALYLTWSFFGGERTYSHYYQQQQKARAEFLSAKANEGVQKAAFQNLLREKLELNRLISIQGEILNRAKKLNAATADEFRRGVKGGGDWLEATSREIAAEKKLLELKTLLSKKELEAFAF